MLPLAFVFTVYRFRDPTSFESESVSLQFVISRNNIFTLSLMIYNILLTFLKDKQMRL